MTELERRRAAVRCEAIVDEAAAVSGLVERAALGAAARRRVGDRAETLVRRVRSSSKPSTMEAFLGAYGLSTREGVALMCLAEAMLRVPDTATIDDLIQDKIAPHDWSARLGDSGSILVNASTWALMLTGRVLDAEDEPGVAAALRSAVRRLGEPVIRTAVGRAMRELGAQFVLGATIDDALDRAARLEAKGYRYSYDMLGEAARTEADALRYLDAYRRAIAALAGTARPGRLHDNPGISVKLSALHPRFETTKRALSVPVLAERVGGLVRAAAEAGITFNIDAEESERLDLTLAVFERVLEDPALADWAGMGLVVQAYAPRAPLVVDWLGALAEARRRRLTVRLVKGAYWDAEIKRAQVLGLEGFPVFTRKVHTDIAYIACARSLLDRRDRLYPQFATHNAHTAAAILELCGSDRSGFEFQRLHGMGEALHEALRVDEGTPCRIYAPVGAHEDLLAYLVRRLLENGANSSFVHQIVDETVPPAAIAKDPFAVVEAEGVTPHRAITRPDALYGPERRNAKGVDLAEPHALDGLIQARAPFVAPRRWRAVSTGCAAAGDGRAVTNPADPSDVVGHVHTADTDVVREAVNTAVAAQPSWAATPTVERAACLRRAADLYEAYMPELLALCAREAGKTLKDAVAEVREAVDFLRYYAQGAAEAEGKGAPLGVVACISPWNFPLAIFTGQVAAALATGNAVVAKPAEQTPLIAARAVALLHEAGVPTGALRLVLGDGPAVGAPLAADPRLGGVCFTGSFEVAKTIERQLARSAPAAVLVAETGGLNAMIVDSTALAEQAVRDIVESAFQSAGQRCSALRMLYVQAEVAPRLLAMLEGAMDLLELGDPWAVATDVGPVIDAEAKARIEAYGAEAAAAGRLLKRLAVPEDGLFVGPTVLSVRGIEDLEREVFGPVLHMATFEADALDDVVRAVNAKGYGLTMGLHTRIDGRVQRVVDAARVGNLYVNRNQIGAIVGVQPFGGEGLSGTGPKAGGPHYLGCFRRRAAAPVPAPPSTVVDGERVTAALDELARLAPAADPMALLTHALDGAAADALAAVQALDRGPLDLPGPTGESNRYRLEPRGTALCLGPDEATALAQAVQALGAGGRALVVVPGAEAATAALAAAGLPVLAIDGCIAPARLTTLAVDVVAWCGEPAPLRQALADRDGPIVPLVTEPMAPRAYCHERCVSIDTTAAGGNATLLAQATG